MLGSRINSPVANGREKFREEKKSVEAGERRDITDRPKKKRFAVALLTLAQLAAAMSRRNGAGLRGVDVP